MAQRRPKITSDDVPLPDEQTIDLSSKIDEPELLVVTNESLKEAGAKEFADWLSFMEEEVEIVIGVSEDPNAENPVSCGVNGEIKYIRRGVQTRLKRKFLDSLIKVRFKVATEQYRDKKGLDQTRVVRKPMLAYQISITDHGNVDPQRSQAWFSYMQQHAQ